MATNVAHDKPGCDVERTTKKIKLVSVGSSAVAVESASSVEDHGESLDASGEDRAEEKATNDEVETAAAAPGTVPNGGGNDDTAETKTEAAQPEEQVVAPEATTTGTSTSTSSGFGGFSSFGGFGGFSSSSSATGSGFASFAATASTSSFSSTSTSTASMSTGFGTLASADADVEGFGKRAEESPEEEPVFTPVATLTEVELENGEEGETILIEKRAKLFKVVNKDFVEVGIGPFRLLRPKAAQEEAAAKASARFVMRRESYPRGPGTKLLLNARVSACVSCLKKSEKTLMLIVVEPVSSEEEDHATNKIKTAAYLLRVASPEDLDAMQSSIKALLPPHTTTS